MQVVHPIGLWCSVSTSGHAIIAAMRDHEVSMHFVVLLIQERAAKDPFFKYSAVTSYFSDY
eukprot:2763746-Amphidinium_carterae.1